MGSFHFSRVDPRGWNSLGRVVTLCLTFGKTTRLFSIDHVSTGNFHPPAWPGPRPLWPCGPFGGPRLIGLTWGKTVIILT